MRRNPLFNGNPIPRLHAALAVGLLLATLGPLSAPAAEKQDFQAGAATSNITPPLGELIVGSFSPRPATDIHDELHARCLVLDDGHTRLAIVLCDNVGIPRGVFDAARKKVHEATGLPPGQVLMAATHTHSATTARWTDRLRPGETFSEYQALVIDRIVAGVQAAFENLEPARIGCGSAQEPTQVFNRRWFMVPGSPTLRNPFGGMDKVRMNPPRASSALLRPAGPTDPEVAFLSVQSADGRPIALLANYSLHYVGGVPSGDVSADYFAIFADLIGQKLGAEDAEPPFVGIMSNGTSGNINNINFRKKRESREPYEKMREVAELVADAVAESHEGVEFRNDVTLEALYRDLTLAVRQPTEEQIAYAKKVLEKPEDAERYHSLEAHYARRVLRQAEAPAEVSVPLQTFRIGEVGIAAIPFEVFVESGLRIKEESPFDATFTISLANGSFGYLPTAEQHTYGGYETWLGTSLVEPDAATKIVDTLLEMFAQLKAKD